MYNLTRVSREVLQLTGAMLSTSDLYALQMVNHQLRNTFAISMKRRKFMTAFTAFLQIVYLLRQTTHFKLGFISPGYDVVIQLTMNSVHIPAGYHISTYIPKDVGGLLSNTIG